MNFLPPLPMITGLYANGLGRDVDAGDRLVTSATALESIGKVEYHSNAVKDLQVSEEFKTPFGYRPGWANIHTRSGRDSHEMLHPHRTRRP
ncbi:MAG TPA: hypothetical protein V6D27_10380 [Vampirovibrionales bacterium]